MFETARSEDIDWLLGPDAGEELARLASVAETTPKLVTGLRRRHSPERAAMLIETAQLRRRGATKFPAADRLFLTAIGLQQATDFEVASWKARRFAGTQRIIDLCCGVGGDLMALAQMGPSLGIDRCDTTAKFAEANCRATGGDARMLIGDATTADLSGAAWHIDPDRRPRGKRTTRVELHEPNLAALDRMRGASPDAAIKLAPAAEPTEDWQRECELEWISRGGQCRQLVVWSGSLAAAPGSRGATMLRGGNAVRFVGRPGAAPRVVDSPGEFLFDPDPSLVAAHLVDAYAAQRGLTRFDPRVVYLTAAAPDPAGMASAFRVRDVLVFKERPIADYLRQRGVGRLEIKHRGLELDPDALRRRLKLRGDESATLIVSPTPSGIRAFVCDRLAAHPAALAESGANG